MTEAGARRERVIPRSAMADAELVNAPKTASPLAGPTHATPAEAPGWAGPLPNFSGAETDTRLIELWLRDKAPETRRQYAQDLEKFADFSGGKPLSSVTLADLQEFAGFVSVLVAPATAARMLSTLKSLFSFAKRPATSPTTSAAHSGCRP